MEELPSETKRKSIIEATSAIRAHNDSIEGARQRRRAQELADRVAGHTKLVDDVISGLSQRKEQVQGWLLEQLNATAAKLSGQDPSKYLVAEPVSEEYVIAEWREGNDELQYAQAPNAAASFLEGLPHFVSVQEPDAAPEQYENDMLLHALNQWFNREYAGAKFMVKEQREMFDHEEPGGFTSRTRRAWVLRLRN